MVRVGESTIYVERLHYSFYEWGERASERGMRIMKHGSVIIKFGPFKGQTGVITRLQGERVIVKVRLGGKTLFVELDQDMIRPTSISPPRRSEGAEKT